VILRSWKNIKAEMSVGKLVGVLIFVVIAMALLPTIISATNAGVNSSDDYGSAQTLLSLVPLFYVIANFKGNSFGSRNSRSGDNVGSPRDSGHRRVIASPQIQPVAE
jgi:hypothetical protein